ncbi:MAG: helix-turn-helix domain-containing protein [Alphaproteobacteria bacterium]|nr:helix-turn-helix domain-containing protein [Alphaproteobacteria bacterium]
MKTYGYARVSTNEQELPAQVEALTKAGADLVRSEKVSGSSPRQDRKELCTLLDFLREGDTLLVYKLDRLARSTKDLLDIVDDLQDRKVRLRTVDGEIDTSTASGRAFVGMLAVFAEFETNLRRERQAEGIRKAKAQGKYKGRKPSVDPATVKSLKADGLGATAIAEKLGISRQSVYRVLQMAEDA